jgi:hypothetical protein
MTSKTFLNIPENGKERRMKRVRWGAPLMVAALILFIVLPTAYADLYIESESVTKGIMGQPDQTKTIKTYYTKNAMRTDSGSSIMIMDLKTMDMYNLNPQTKTYTKMNLNDMGAEMAGAAKMMGEMKVNATGETKTIAGYKCKKYTMDSMMGTMEFWVSKDVKGYKELKSISEDMAKAFDKNPLLKQMNNMSMMNKMDGVPVMTQNSIMGGTITTTLKKTEQKSLSKDLFKVPDGYKLQQRRQHQRPPPGMPPPGKPY